MININLNVFKLRGCLWLVAYAFVPMSMLIKHVAITNILDVVLDCHLQWEEHIKVHL